MATPIDPPNDQINASARQIDLKPLIPTTSSETGDDTTIPATGHAYP